MKNLKITFYLKTPLSLSFPWFSLDSLLMHTLLERRDDYYYLPTKVPVEVEEPPLKKWRDIYVASVSIYEGEPFVFSYYKRGDFPFPRGKIRPGSGFFKMFMLKAVYYPVRTVTFYATGDEEKLLDILSDVTTLGKECNIGFGWVQKFEIEETDGEYGLVKDGKCMRPIPVEYLDEYEDAAMLAYKPPYWAKENIRLCAVPGSRCKLKSG